MTWPEALEQFQSYLLLERSLSRHTIEAYLRDVNKLAQYLEISGRTDGPTGVDAPTLSRFIHWMNELGLEHSSQARLISGLRAFYKFLLVDDHIAEDPTDLLDAPRIRRKIPSVLSVDEMQRLLNAVDLSEPLGLRNRAMLEVLYACGLRVSELTGLSLNNLFLDAGFIKVLGKNNKERLVPIGGEAVKHLRHYLAHARAEPAAKAEHVVFLNRRGRPLTRVMVFYIIKALSAEAGIDKTISPHTFRHTFATHLIEGGADLKAVQDMLGHESITTTEIYTHMDTEYLRETILLHHPRMRF